MKLIAGVDEAGYGPRLGPLVTSACAFRVPDTNPADPAGLWTALSATVARPGRGAGGRLAVGDSKKLYSGGRSLARMEGSLLAFLSAGGFPAGTPEELCGHLLSERCRASLAEHPWYASRGERLPLDAEADEIAPSAERLRADCSAGGVELAMIRSRALAEGEFNRRVDFLDNKATVLAGLVIELLGELRRAAGGDELDVYVDRLGGRTDYAPLLAETFPGAFVWEGERDAARQSYRIDGLAGPTRVTFTVKGDRDCFPVALASMTSKYLREVFMRRFNAYWQDVDDQIPSTSGYWADAGPFLAAIEPHRERMNIGDSALVRQR